MYTHKHTHTWWRQCNALMVAIQVMQGGGPHTAGHRGAPVGHHSGSGPLQQGFSSLLWLWLWLWLCCGGGCHIKMLLCCFFWFLMPSHRLANYFLEKQPGELWGRSNNARSAVKKHIKVASLECTTAK